MSAPASDATAVTPARQFPATSSAPAGRNGAAATSTAAAHRRIALGGPDATGAYDAATGTSAPALLDPVNAHRRLRGPYTAAGTILRAIVTDALARFPELVSAHEIEILSVAPELRATVPATRETLTSLAIPKERTRFYSRLRTLRIAHGLNDFVRDYVRQASDGPRSLVIEHVEEADPTDQEFISVLLRRMPADVLALSVVTAADAALEPVLETALNRYTTLVTASAAPAAASAPGASPLDLARAFVATECLSTDPALRAAYDQLSAEQKAALHDARADELNALNEPTLRLGAVPFHRALGGDPSGAGVIAQLAAADWCIENGFYHATLELGRRGLDLVGEIDDDADPMADWWPLTTKVTMSLAALDRAEEALPVYNAVRARTTSPRVHMHAAYATSMLYTRHLPEEQRDHRLALGWINIAIALAEQLDDGENDRAFSTVFQQNGRALVEGHLGNAENALALVTAGIDRLAKELGDDEQSLHRSVLRHNRAQVLKGLGRLEEARQDYETVIALDPNYAEYHFEYAGLLRRLGREEEALEEYARAMRLTPPFVELYYNRGDLRAVRGDVDGALADFNYAIELDPEYVDAYVNRAALLLGLGDIEAAAADVEAGLALDPVNPHLRCQKARALWEAGDASAAAELLDAMLGGGSRPEGEATQDAADAEDPATALAQAWALRAAVRFDQGDKPGALSDLDKALSIEQSAVLFYNRGTVREALEQWSGAAEDYTRAIALDPADPDPLLRRAACSARLGDSAAATSDLAAFTGLAPERGPEAEAVLAG